MASTKLFLLQLLLVSVVSASNYYGTSATFAYKGKNPDGTYKVRIYNRDTFRKCESSNNWTCSSGQCGTSSRSHPTMTGDTYYGEDSPDNWCETETVVTRNVTSDKPFQLRAEGCCWNETSNAASRLVALTDVDLGKRSDTGEPNKSPVVTILPVLRVPGNCRRVIKLMSFDPDGDHVRCRYGTKKNGECSKCYQQSGFHLEKNSCELQINQFPDYRRAYTFELMVEDYLRRHIELHYSDGSQRNATATSPPLSKLPVQFTLLAEKSASCAEGVVMPKFVEPTPKDGALILAEIGSAMDIRVKAEVSRSKITALTISGPAGVQWSSKQYGEFSITWTPAADQVGEFFPICFAAESSLKDTTTSSTGRRLNAPVRHGYHSEMRCVAVEVVRQIVKSHVICNETSMKILVEKASFPRLSEDQLRLNDPSNTVCRLQTHSNSTHVIGVVPLSQCGTQIEEDDDYLIFKNELTTLEDVRNVVTRKHLLEVQFFCQYPKRGNVSQSFSVHRKNMTVWERGFGTFTYGFEFYEDSSYRNMINPNLYPLEVEIGSRLYMKIEATSSLNNTEMFVESCRAAPYDNPNYRSPYNIITNGCTEDETVVVYPRAHNKQYLFSMEAFKFIGLYNQVYISCSVIMCEAGNSDARCSKGCVNSTGNHHLRKREAVIQSGIHFISQGPLRLKRSAENSDSSAIALNLNLVFIAGCALAAVGMICGVVLYKTKASKIKYQPLPACET